jgi:hypothetical protein
MNYSNTMLDKDRFGSAAPTISLGQRSLPRAAGRGAFGWGVICPRIALMKAKLHQDKLNQ